MEYIPELMKCPLFFNLNYDEVEQLIGYCGMKWHSYRKQDLLVHAGEPMAGLMVIIKGKVTTIHVGNANMDGVVDILTSGDVFGSAYIVKNSPTLVSVRATTATSVLYLPMQNGWRFSNAAPPCYHIFMENLVALLATKVVSLAQKMDYLHLGSVRAKVAAYCINQSRLTGSATFTPAINRSRLAEYLGISRPSMVREMGRMEEEGLLILEGKTITVQSEEALSQLICP